MRDMEENTFMKHRLMYDECTIIRNKKEKNKE